MPPASASMSSNCCRVICFRSRRSLRTSRIAASPFPTCERSVSLSRTSVPCCTAMDVMPAPMKPAPRTAILLTAAGSGAGSGTPMSFLSDCVAKNRKTSSLRLGRHRHLPEHARLFAQSQLHAVRQPVLHHVDRGERRRIVAARLLDNALARLPVHQGASERVAVERHGRDTAPTRVRSAALWLQRPVRQLRRSPRGDLQENGRMHHLVHKADLERLLRAHVLSREDHVERRCERRRAAAGAACRRCRG